MSARPNNLAKILGIIAGVLAWTAALIGYLDDGKVKLGLLAAGVFFAVLPFASSGKPKPKGPTEP